MPYIGN